MKMSLGNIHVNEGSENKSRGRQRRKTTLWTREKIAKLIELYRSSDCLWNHYSELYKNKDCRAKAIDSICASLNINKFEFGKKVHNLRNQFNSEMKKLERRLEESGSASPTVEKTCRWEHFETLMFLRSVIEPRPGYQTSTQTLCKKLEPKHELATTNINTPVNFDDNENANDAALNTNNSISPPTTSSASLIPVNQNSGRTAENNISSIPALASAARDQWDAFGELIANEFRNLNSDQSRKKLKRRIMQVLLEVDEEDDKQHNVAINL